MTAAREWLGASNPPARREHRRAPAGRQRLSNTSCLINPDGDTVAAYRRVHMFDATSAASAIASPSARRPATSSSLAEVSGVEVGLSVCYELRFPELYRVLAVRGARILTVPAAFTEVTGRDHWLVLLRARAIENQAFVIAPNQHGEAPPHYRSYGRSAIVDPWGVVLAQAPDGEGFVVADLDLERQREVRASLPSLANRRPEAYRWPDPIEAPG